VIRKRLIILFVLQIAIVLLVSGFYLRYHLQNVLENELGVKLETTAAAIATQLDASLISILAPGDEETRTFHNLMQRVTDIKLATHMQRIVAFSPDGRVWIDTQTSNRIGERYLRQDFDRVEIRTVLQGRTTSSVLFVGNDGRMFKSGYAPLRLRDQIAGIIAVEGSAQSLQAIRAFQRKLLHIGAFSLLFSFILAFFTSHRMTAPLLRLQAAAKNIGQGKLDQAIATKGEDEIAFLARTMEEMRKAIIQRDEQQKAMLAGVAHEIRNPLGGIELFAGLLLDDLTRSEMRERAEKILKESKNLRTLIQNFIDYAKPVVPKREPCSVADSWQEALQFISDQANSHRVQNNFSGHATALVDQQHLKQVFLNLGLNAIQSMPKGGSIEIRAINEKNRVRIDFSDTGTGIPEEMQPHIFEPFYSSKEKGLGLGLAIVKNLLEQNGGSIRLKKTSSSGSTFEIALPLTNGS
jgi:signal transduction histidine kinase